MKRIIFSLWFIVYGLLPFVYAQDETLTLLTYYPAPYGMYARIGIGPNIQFLDPVESRTVLKIDDDARESTTGTALLTVGTYRESGNSAIFAYQPGLAGAAANGIKTRIISTSAMGATGAITAVAGYALGSEKSGNITGIYGYAFNNTAGASTNAYGGNFYSLHDTTGTNYGVYASSTNEGAGAAYGGYFTVNQFGTGAHYGIRSISDSINSSGETYGIHNKSNSSNQDGKVFGIYNEATTNGTGAVYGIASNLTATGNGAGLLKTGIGNYTTVNGPDNSPLVGIDNSALTSGNGSVEGIQNNASTSSGTAYVYGIENAVANSNIIGTGDVTGILNTTTSNGKNKTYGISNNVTANGNNSDLTYGSYTFLGVNGTDVVGTAHEKYGTYSGAKIYNADNKSDVYGIRTDGVTGGGGKAYGVYTSSSSNTGASYGIYASAIGPAGNTWAGYFVGNVKFGTDAVGSAPNVNYIYDVAELIPCAGDVESGDIVVINPDKDREVMKCTKENQITAGVISEDPTLSFGDRENARELEPEKNWNFLALAGQVYCKVDASYSEIKRGDLLTTSPTPGHAMKAVNPKIGTIVGKALEPHKDGKGKILVLVSPM